MTSSGEAAIFVASETPGVGAVAQQRGDLGALVEDRGDEGRVVPLGLPNSEARVT